MQYNKGKLPDVQKTKIKDTAISSVGEENIDFQFKVYRKNRKDFVATAAKVDVYHWLQGNRKGTNMSRIMEVLMAGREKPLDKKNLKLLLMDMITSLERKEPKEPKVLVKDVYIAIRFTYFMEKEAPYSKKVGLLGYDCAFYGKLMRTNSPDKFLFTHAIEVNVPVTSLCPCSKEISKYGAHNQRSKISVTVQLKPDRTLWLEDLIQLIEKQGSCEIYSLLKRDDERVVTERAYENPNFVEDMVRKARRACETLNEVKAFKVGVVNYESIHTHNAVAHMKRIRKGRIWISPYKKDIL